jgi:hypothetical protein
MYLEIFIENDSDSLQRWQNNSLPTMDMPATPFNVTEYLDGV